jgi:hypothetical protein
VFTRTKREQFVSADAVTVITREMSVPGDDGLYHSAHGHRNMDVMSSRLRNTLLTLQRTLPFIMYAAMSAAAAESPKSGDCVRQDVAFDGIAPLTYATVTPYAANRVGFHHDYPEGCDAGDTMACPSKAYLVSGDAVAIGKTCGTWTYVQFLGEKRISVGWVAADRLAPLPTQPSPKAPQGTMRYLVTLRKGTDVPVCHAYLQRLNQTDFALPPFCGRPEDTHVPGFAYLNRVWVPIAEINRLQFEVERFIFDQPQDSTLHRTPYPANTRLASYRFDPPVSIQNDGRSEDVVLWNDDTRDDLDCNSTSGPIPLSHRSNQVPIILSDDRSRPDKLRTNATFGHPLTGQPLPGLAPQKMENGGYAVLGYTYGIFEYRGVYYFDTFFDASPGAVVDIAQANTTDIIENVIGVFVRGRGQTHEVCELSVDQ